MLRKFRRAVFTDGAVQIAILLLTFAVCSAMWLNDSMSGWRVIASLPIAFICIRIAMKGWGVVAGWLLPASGKYQIEAKDRGDSWLVVSDTLFTLKSEAEVTKEELAKTMKIDSGRLRVVKHKPTQQRAFCVEKVLRSPTKIRRAVSELPNDVLARIALDV